MNYKDLVHALNACVVSVVAKDLSPQLFKLFADEVVRLIDANGEFENDALVDKVRLHVISIRYKLKNKEARVVGQPFSLFLDSLPDDLRVACAQ